MGGRPRRRIKKMPPKTLHTAIKTLAETGSEVRAMVAAGFGRKVLTILLERRPAFRRAWDHAIADFKDAAEQELLRRATQGVQRHKFFKGKMVMVDETLADGKKRKVPYVEREFSDGLLVKWLEANMPEKYGPKSKVELSGADGVPLVPVLNVFIEPARD